MLTALGGEFPEDRFCPRLRDEVERSTVRDHQAKSERERPSARWAARLNPRQRPGRAPAEGRCQAVR